MKTPFDQLIDHIEEYGKEYSDSEILPRPWKVLHRHGWNIARLHGNSKKQINVRTPVSHITLIRGNKEDEPFIRSLLII